MPFPSSGAWSRSNELFAAELAAEGADAEDERRSIRPLGFCVHGASASIKVILTKSLPLDGEFHGVSNAALDGKARQPQKPFRQKFREAKPIASTRAPG